MIDTLRNAAAAGTGWPYIAPNKNTGDKPPKGALTLFERTTWKMYQDLVKVGQDVLLSETLNVLGNSRQRQPLANDTRRYAVGVEPIA